MDTERLTFNENGKYKVVGMNENNESEKIIECVNKLGKIEDIFEKCAISCEFDKLNFNSKDKVSEYYADKVLRFRPYSWNQILPKAEKLAKAKTDVKYIAIMQFVSNLSIYTLYAVKLDETLCFEVSDDFKICKDFELSENGYYNAVKFCRSLFLMEKEI